jgi:hypothetical protein
MLISLFSTYKNKNLSNREKSRRTAEGKAKSSVKLL